MLQIIHAPFPAPLPQDLGHVGLEMFVAETGAKILNGGDGIGEAGGWVPESGSTMFFRARRTTQEKR